MNNDIDYDTRQLFTSEKLNSIGQTETIFISLQTVVKVKVYFEIGLHSR